MNKLKYTLYFTQLLLSIENNNNDIQDICLKLNKELENQNDEVILIFLSQFTNNTIKLFKFNELNQVEQYTGKLQDWLKQIPCLLSYIDIHQYALLIQYIIISRIYFPEADPYFKNNYLNTLLNNIDLIKNNTIKIVFLNYCLEYYLQQGISLMYKDTCDRIINIVEKLVEDGFQDKGFFKLPVLESEMNK